MLNKSKLHDQIEEKEKNDFVWCKNTKTPLIKII